MFNLLEINVTARSNHNHFLPDFFSKGVSREDQPPVSDWLGFTLGVVTSIVLSVHVVHC